MKTKDHSKDMSRFEDNIRMDLREKVCNAVHSIHLAQNRYRWRTLVNMVMDLRAP